MEIIKAKRMVRYYMKKNLKSSWKVKYFKDKSMYGKCEYDTKTIHLSLYFVRKCNRENVRDTILHEICHALTEDDPGHGKDWQNLAKSMNIHPRMHPK